MKSYLQKSLLSLLLVLLIVFNSISSISAEEETKEEYYGPINGVEVTTLREEYGKHYALPDGTMQYIGSSRRVHFKDSNGVFQEFDNTVIDEIYFDGENTYAYTNQASDLVCRFSENNEQSSNIAMIEYGGTKLTIGLPETSFQVEDIKDTDVTSLLPGLVDTEDSILYNTNTGAHILYYITSEALKEYLLIDNPDCLEYRYLLTFDNLYPVESENGVLFLDESNQLVFDMSGLYAFDMNQEYSDAVQLRSYQVEEGQLEVIVTIDSEWALSQDRAYPIIVDPSVTISGPSSTSDAFISSTNSNTNYGSNTLLRTGNFSTYGICRSALYFGLPNIDPTLILSATISIKKSSGSTPAVTAYALQGSWGESSIKWSNAPYMSTTIHSSTSASAPSLGTNWYSMPASDIISSWINGTLSNYGVMLKESSDDTTTKYDSFYSSEAATANCPQISVLYVNPKAYLLGVPSTDANNGTTHDHSSCLQTIGGYLQDVDYAPVYKFTSPTINSLNSTFNSTYSKIFVSRSHGGFVSDSSNNAVLTFLYLGDTEASFPSNGTVAERVAYAETHGYTSNQIASCNLSGKRIVLFIGCFTGFNLGESAPNNLPYKAVSSGADVAIGFKSSILCTSANTWTTSLFYKMIYQGKEIGEALDELSASLLYNGTGLEYLEKYGNLNCTIE